MPSTQVPEIEIAGRRIGAGHPPYIVAELSANHNGTLERALLIMEAIKEAGADAVKLQTYTPGTITLDHDGPAFRIRGGLWDGYRLFDLYEKAQTPFEWHEPLFRKGEELGLTVFSTAFDDTAIDLLESLDTPAYKIASFECVDIPLIERAARTGRPLVISTGMASLAEIADAVAAVRRAGAPPLALLHCVSAYPTNPHDVNLRNVAHLSESFGCVSGFSDHTLGTAVAVAAIALGASIIEKHVTLRRDDGGLDSKFSLEPHELAHLVRDCREAWESIGEIMYERSDAEMTNLGLRPSLYAVETISSGEKLTERNVRSIRPGGGLAPKHLRDVLGRVARRDIARGTPLSWNLIE